MVKVELHAHTADDRYDRIPHSARQLVDHAASLGYGALAITLHDTPFDPAPLAAHARSRGLTLIAGIERSIEGRHVLLLNFPNDAVDVGSLAELMALKASCPDGLIVAPHPCYPIPSALGLERLERHAEAWDAVEVSAMYVRGLDFNRRAVAWARAHGKPLVGNGDVHRLAQLGTSWTEVDVPPGADATAICAAVRAGRTRVVTRPLGHLEAASLFGRMVLGGLRGRVGGWGLQTSDLKT